MENNKPAEPAATPQKKRLMRKPYDHGEPPHEECPDCRGVCSPVEPTAPADSTPQKCPKCGQPIKPMYADEPREEWEHVCKPEANSTRPESSFLGALKRVQHNSKQSFGREDGEMALDLLSELLEAMITKEEDENGR